MRWALAVTCACRLASAKGSIRKTQLTKLRSRPTEPVSSINNTPTPASCCSNTQKVADSPHDVWIAVSQRVHQQQLHQQRRHQQHPHTCLMLQQHTKVGLTKFWLTKLRSSPTEPVSSINNTPTPASCCSNTDKVADSPHDVWIAVSQRVHQQQLHQQRRHQQHPHTCLMLQQHTKVGLTKFWLTKLRSSPTEPISSINNIPTLASCCSNMQNFLTEFAYVW